MLGSKNRDYKTEARARDRRIEKHIELTNKYVSEGMNADAASKKAFDEVMNSNINGKK